MYAICAMSTHIEDQIKVEELHGVHPDVVRPYYGFHPWWSHIYTFTEGIGKKEHYEALFLDGKKEDIKLQQIDALLDALPSPIHFQILLDDVERRLQRNARAQVGEVGIDKVFRVKGKDGKLTLLQTSIEHQKRVAVEQIKLAKKYNRVPQHAQFQYAAMSSLVLQSNRSARPDEPTGQAETLAGKVTARDMGTRATRETVKDKDKKKLKSQMDDDGSSTAKRSASNKGYGYSNILEATQDMEGLDYRPRTAETTQVYELILSVVHSILGDTPQDTIRSAADVALGVLKDESLKDFDKKREIEGFVGHISEELYSQLLGLSKKITDYGDADVVMADPDAEKKEGEIDDEGVALLFEDDNEEDDDEERYEVGDDQSEDEEKNDVEEEQEQLDDDGNALVIGGEKKQSAESRGKLAATDVDAFWLQRIIAQHYPDPVETTEKTSAVFDLLASEAGAREVENGLMDLFDYERDLFKLVQLLLINRDLIYWCTRLARASDDEKMDIEVTMREKGVGWILRELKGEKPKRETGEMAMEVDQSKQTVPSKATLAPGSTVAPKRVVDLDSMTFSAGGHLMSNKRVKLPDGSFKRSKKGYEEIHVPAPKVTPVKEGELVPLTKLPEWTRKAFPGTKALNRVQSKLYPVAFGQDDPILLCAPTGAGKTNVAMLTILNTISQYRDEETGAIDLDAFKIVYVAPMKALVQEQVGSFSKRLEPFGVKVNELTGDSQLTKQQIAETQVIVTTPEKWDVITRKSTDTSYTNLVRLMIVDEIHLLHDDRGPVLESIIARTIRKMEQNNEYTRVVGLSATLPNYQDVAAFLRVDINKGLFYFDGSMRPCPLQQQFVGITEKKAIKRFSTMNEVCYEKVLEQAGKNQVIVFVHSRKDTAKTAKFLRDMAVEKDTITQFVNADSASRAILTEEAENSSSGDMKDLLPFGFAIHHAGMTRADRNASEDLFDKGHVQVLVCTATLAWGVNLPAHSVIIKGTQIYNPEKGRWCELSPQDVLQMLGRAGRPQYDTFGEGIIITNHTELQYYLSLMNQQLPIESQYVSRLVDNLNAEVVLGSIRNRDEAIQWLGYTYLYIRMLRSPSLYSVGEDYDDDLGLVQKRSDIVHTAAVQLDKGGLVKYDRKSGILQGTELGRIASHFYITNTSMAAYMKNLRPTMSLIELFRVFALSNEFKLIPVRQEEKLELQKLMERVPIPVKESVDEPAAKINVLLQAFISDLRLDGLALVSDMVFVQQSAGRIIRAIFEICLKRGWAALTRDALDLCKMIDKKLWKTMTPLRQFKGIRQDAFQEVVKKAERKEFPWYRYFDLDPPELGELIGNPKAGKLVHKMVHSFPKLNLQANVQPITRSLLRIDLSIQPDFEWDEKNHGTSELFWILVEDVDGEIILFHDTFLLRERYSQDEHYVTLTVPMSEPIPPNYYVTVMSDRWLHSETTLPVSFKHLILPEKFPPPTPLLDLQPLPISALHNKAYENIYTPSNDNEYAIESFNKIQTQVFQALYTSDDSVIIGAPTGSGKTICAEFALLRFWQKSGSSRAVVIEPFDDVVSQRVDEWSQKFSRLDKEIVGLTGDMSADLKLLERGDVIIATPQQWDMLSRRWKQRKNVQNLGLFVADEVQLIGQPDIGPTYEIIVSRMRYIAAQTENPTRIVACSVSLSNAKIIGDWIGAGSQGIFNFSPSSRPLPMEVHLQNYSTPHFPSLMLSMAKPAYLSITEWAASKSVIAFVPSRKQCYLTSQDILTYCQADGSDRRFLNIELSELEPHLEHVQDEELKEVLKYGIAYYHEGLSKQDKVIVETLYNANAIQLVIASRDVAWSIPMRCFMVIIMGVQAFDGREHRYVDYPVTDILQMIGRASRPAQDSTSKCVFMCQSSRKDYFKKFLAEPLPVESHLKYVLPDHFNAEIVTKTIENKQDAIDYLTWTYFYRRMQSNPNFYELSGTSHAHLSDSLSELVEDTLNQLVEAKCITIEDEMDTLPLNLGMIASYYYISSFTVETFQSSLKATTKLKGILEIVASAAEFELVPIRKGEANILRRLYDRVPVKLDRIDFESPYFKTFVLLQAHFSRLQLPADLLQDQAEVLKRVLNLLSAAVDVMSSNGYLGAIGAMDLSQMVVQAIWDQDVSIKQIPHFNEQIISRGKEMQIESVYDIMEMEDEDRSKLLAGLDKFRVQDVAKFVNNYPSIDVEYDIDTKQDMRAGEPIPLTVRLSQDVEEDEEVDQSVMAPFYPLHKMCNWWLVVGDTRSKSLLGIKKVSVAKSLNVKLDFQLEEEGTYKDVKLYLICDSYSGCDQDFQLPELEVQEGLESDEDEDEQMSE
ncbi:hypothetical protein E3P84_00909 [Wallemia ichthyophaga]|nr:hypothetical protein E3P84_00909 [Wallemia ichthyophaga]TIB43985.1 hypothetical protein E3P83_00347 [Wallemia ichthyophaga]